MNDVRDIRPSDNDDSGEYQRPDETEAEYFARIETQADRGTWYDQDR